MREFTRFVLTSTLALAGVGMATNAYAQCAFNSPTKAKGLKTDMIRAYASCPGVTFPSPNTSTMSGVPGCAPPEPLSSFQFGDGGACNVQVQPKIEDQCSDGGGGACNNVRIKAKCKGVEDSGALPIVGAGWTLRLILRVTTDDDSNGDMTVIDSPLEVQFPDAAGGKLKLKASVVDLVFTPPGNPIRGCSNVELLSIAIADPSGEIFARPGSSTRE